MMRRVAFAAAVAAVLISVLARAQAPPPSAAPEAEIRTLIGTTLPARINATDAKGTAALWSEKATHSGMVRGARVREGRVGVEQMWASGFSQPGRDAERKLSVTVSAVRFVRPDIAVVDAQNTYRGGKRADGTPNADTGELLFLVLARENGTWLISASRVVPLIGPRRP
jgi:uncharacterized protein (TIGR02246 family)